MACCGNSKHCAPFPVGAPGRSANRPVMFEYGGPNSLTIFGRATGIRYHFPGPGARACVLVVAIAVTNMANRVNVETRQISGEWTEPIVQTVGQAA